MKMLAMLEDRHLKWRREQCDEARRLLSLIDQRGFRFEGSEALHTQRDSTADLTEHQSRAINQLTSIINKSAAR